MTMHLHIERLVLEGAPFEGMHGRSVQTAVEQELARLLASGPATPFRADAALVSVNGGSIQVAERADPAGLGEQIATAVHAGIGDAE
jgi:hypothetical protein